MSTRRWQKDGGPVVRSLPPWDRGADGQMWTHLEENPEAQAACGWTELPSVPGEVTRAQARAALLDAGILEEVDAWVTAHASAEAKIYWQSQPMVRRDSILLAELAPQFGISDDQLDDLFRAAELKP